MDNNIPVGLSLGYNNLFFYSVSNYSCRLGILIRLRLINMITQKCS